MNISDIYIAMQRSFQMNRSTRRAMMKYTKNLFDTESCFTEQQIIRHTGTQLFYYFSPVYLIKSKNAISKPGLFK